MALTSRVALDPLFQVHLLYLDRDLVVVVVLVLTRPVRDQKYVIDIDCSILASVLLIIRQNDTDIGSVKSVHHRKELGIYLPN